MGLVGLMGLVGSVPGGLVVAMRGQVGARPEVVVVEVGVEVLGLQVVEDLDRRHRAGTLPNVSSM